MTNRLFFYGTLMDDDVRKAIVGRPVDVAAASLQGYRRVPVAGRTYPMLVPCQGQCIEGLLADGIDARELKRLIRYEGPEYRIHTLMVQDQPALARDRLTPSHESDTELNVNRSLKQIGRADSRSQSKPVNGFDFKRPALVFMARPGIAGSYHQDWDLDVWQRCHKRRFFSRKLATG